MIDEYSDERGFLLKGISRLTSVLCSEDVSDLTPFNGLIDLTRLSCITSNVSDLSPIRGLTKLTKFSLSASGFLEDISPLSSLINIAHLMFSGSGISDIYPLSNLFRLECLHLSATEVSNIFPLRELKSLKILHLSHTRVSDLAPISALVNLTNFVLFRNTSVGNFSHPRFKKIENSRIRFHSCFKPFTSSRSH